MVDDLFGACDRDGCDEPCPMDMPAIILDDEAIACSPDCALVLVAGRAETTRVTYHDPQFATDRARLGVAADVVDISRAVTSQADAEAAIRDIATFHPSRFRVARDED